MRDLSITEEMIDEWLHDAILGIVVGGILAESVVGVVPINETTIHGHVWVKYKVNHLAPQNTPAFQFFFRYTSEEQRDRAVRMVRKMIDDCEVTIQHKAERERLVPTTPLDELAKILKDR